MKESKDIDRLHSISRFIIFLPLILVLAFLFFNSLSRKENYGVNPQVPVISQQPANNSVNSNDTLMSENSGQKLDLQGPTVCTYKDGTTDSTAYIKNKNIYAKQISSKSTTEFILKGDCVYIWEKDSSNGQKICGVSQYLDLLTMFSSTPLFDLNTIVPMLLGGKTDLEVPEKIPDLDKVCKKGEVDENLFNIPTNIDFKVKSK